MGLEASFGEGFLTTRIDAVINWARANSIFPMTYATACCGIEVMGMVSSVYDISRFGAEAIRFSPRQSDLLLVAGTINYKQSVILRRFYEQMPDPKYVIAMGVCASSGGFYDNYCVVQGIDEVIPVDVYVAGCPPRPEAVLDAIIKIQQERIGRQTVLEAPDAPVLSPTQGISTARRRTK